MAWAVTGDLAHNGMVESGTHGCSQNKQEGSSQWYLSKKDIEENSPSRRDGIDLKKETYLRKSYCTFMQDLGMRLKVPQVTIATAIIFCHRFFLYQSHAKNDRRTIAAVCMFLAGKVEETPRPLKDVIIVSYEIIHKRDPAAGQRIRQRDVYEQQKGLILTGERVVLTTLGFDLNVLQPYRPLVEAIKKLKVAQNSLAQVAWNFVNDGLRTSLCLQFKAHHIAAGAIFLAAKFLKVKLPSEGEKVWWKEFGVTARQLEEVSNQMLELYEQNRTPTSQGSEAGASPGGWASHQAPVKLVTGEGSVSQKSHSQLERMSTVKPGSVKPGSLNPSIASSGSDQRHANYKEGDLHENSQSRSNDHGSTESKSDISEHRLDDEIKESRHPKQHPLPHITDKMSEASDRSRFGSKPKIEVGMEDVKPTNTELEEQKSEITTGKIDCKNLENKDYLGLQREDGIKKIDKEKVKAALEKRKKSRGDVARKELMDDDDLIERELEDGIELAIEDEKVKRRGNQDQFNPSNSHYEKDPKKIGNDIQQDTEKQGSRRLHADDVEDGELSMIDDVELPQSPKSISRKRKAESPGRHLDDISSGDRNWVGQHNYMEKDHKRHAADNRM